MVLGLHYSVQQVGQRSDTHWQRLRIRTNERGVLEDQFAARRVWTWDTAQAQTRPGMVGHAHRAPWATTAMPSAMRHKVLLCSAWPNGGVGAISSNGLFKTPKTRKDGMSFQAQKYLAWEHHVALTACALWFIATTKLSWAKECQRDPELLQHLQVQVLPALSTANVREMMRSVMPLPQLSLEEAQAQVVKHLVNRSRSTASRLRHHRKAAAPT